MSTFGVFAFVPSSCDSQASMPGEDGCKSDGHLDTLRSIIYQVLVERRSSYVKVRLATPEAAVFGILASKDDKNDYQHQCSLISGTFV